jgi:hypothetical protein
MLLCWDEKKMKRKKGLEVPPSPLLSLPPLPLLSFFFALLPFFFILPFFYAAIVCIRFL